MTIRLKTGRAKDGRLLAIAYEKRGDDTYVLDVEVVPDEAAAKVWFDEVCVTQPWEERQ